MRQAQRLAACAIALTAAVGCTGGPTTEGFDQRMGSYVGRSEGDLVGSLGVPNRTYNDPTGRRLLQYDFADLSPTPSITPSIGFGIGGFGFGRGGGIGTGVGLGVGAPLGGPAASRCSAVFEVRGGSVSGFTRQGSGCVAPAPA